MNIAWGFLEPIQIAQLLHYHPELCEEYRQWKYGNRQESKEIKEES